MRGNLLEEVVGVNVVIKELGPSTSPECSNIRLIPDVKDKAVEHVVSFDVFDELSQEGVGFGPVAIVAGEARDVAAVCSP